ncbi:hypothetical protein [Streptomyces sp. NPDC048277]|uniref:hypothetical protein n=1 Tax=Streptomyces sp. NPDC048277 TaxID=3155027 RepID=UPI0033FE267A
MERQLALENVEILVVPLVHVRCGTCDARREGELLDGEVAACVLGGALEEVCDTGDVDMFTVRRTAQQWTGGKTVLITGRGSTVP